MAKQKSNLFLISWDLHGLEAVVDIGDLEQLETEMEQRRLMAILRDPDLRDPGRSNYVGQLVNNVLLRARINSHRHYEVYTIHTTSDVDKEQLAELFKEDPRTATELIRAHGNCVYSDRIKEI